MIDSSKHLIIESANNRFALCDPRRFGSVDLIGTEALGEWQPFAAMGPEPLGEELSASYLKTALAGRKQAIKLCLLDQRIVAGLGNIYVCEALWRAGLSPKRKASTITRKGGKATARSEALALHIRDVIAEAIEAGGSSLRDHRQTNGDLGYFQHRFSAYGREGKACVKSGCGGTIKRLVQSGRSTFFCPDCQR